MKLTRMRVATVVLDCGDAHALAAFYAELLGWKPTVVEPDWVLMRDPAGGTGLSFQSEPDYEAPVWPEEAGKQQKMIHLDLLVEELEGAVEHALSCGARLAREQYYEGVRVLLDPAGHPFCLFVAPDVELPPQREPHAQNSEEGLAVMEVDGPEQKEQLSLHLMHGLRKWFNPAADIERKAVMHRDMPFFCVLDGQKPVGFLALKPHTGYAWEIFNMGVLEEYHGRGAGRGLVDEAAGYCRERGAVCLTVKTLDSSVDYEPYARTRAFYLSQGFVPVEVMPHYWDEDNPCLLMIKSLK